ncbi:MAG: hypothetical protein P8J93_01445 [SAR86 cluster bacterium]|nr:hypothetical protein [SAR86 cluster bacterium]|tara:strand:- start:2916 stop:3116 length:201 start_codon:yes stop_codon:yes gene_type:complete
MKDKEKIDWIVKTINEDLSLQEDSWILFDWEDNGLLEVSVNGINVKNVDGLIDAYQEYLISKEEDL